MHIKSILFVASIFGVATAAGCSSSSSSSPATTDDASTDDGSTSSSSSGGEAGISLACTSASDCTTAGQICCGTLMGTSPGTACQAGPCAPLPVIGLAVQLCKTSAECTGGATCGAPTNMLLAGVLMGMTICNAPAGGEGGVEAGGSSGGDAATEGGSSSGGSDAATESGSSSGGSEAGTDAPTGG